MKVTNNTIQTLDFNVGGSTKGEANTESIAPGETKEMNLDRDSAQVKGHLIAGTISISGGRAEKAPAK